MNDEALGCLWCNREYQLEERERRAAELLENQSAHKSMLRRINALVVLAIFAIMAGLSNDIFNLDDLLRYKDVISEAAGMMATAMQAIS